MSFFKNYRKNAILIFLISAVIIFGCSKQKYDFPKNVISLCESQSNIECFGDCLDGESMTAYYDKTNKKFDKITNFELTKEQEEASLAVHSSSICNKCYNRFELKENGNFKKATCEEFFHTIQQKNKSCNGCIDVIHTECC